jgi:hypothetical protein
MLEKPTITEIYELKKTLVGEKGSSGIYSGLRREQKTDQEFCDDVFGVNIKSPYHVIRTGSAARIADNITDHIDTSNPQATRKAKKETQVEIQRAAKIAKLLNHWLPRLIEEIEESLKNANRRGEAFVKIDYNPNYDVNDDDSIPLILTAEEPMILYPDPYEYMGIPRRMIKSCYMSVSQVKQLFPEWNNPKRRHYGKDNVEYFAYWDKDWRYLEADGVALLPQGIQENVFHFVPFVHCYSGYGKRSPEGKPEDEAVGRLRKLRGRLIEECEVESRLDSVIGLYANPTLILKPTSPESKVPEEGEIELTPGSVNVLDWGWDYEIRSADPAIIQPLVYHLAQIRGVLGLETPSVSMGMPSTSRATGRQEDIYVEQYGRKYRKLISNIERLWSTALGLCLRALDTIPALLPIEVKATVIKEGEKVREEEKINKEDIGGYYECKVELKPKDALIEDRKTQLGRLLVNEGRIDWKTFLTEYVGYTNDKAEEVITQTLVDQAIFSPQFINITIKEALEKLGMQKHIEELEKQASEQMQMQQQLSQMGRPQFRPSEARNPQAADIARQLLQESPQPIRQTSAGYEQR